MTKYLLATSIFAVTLGAFAAPRQEDYAVDAVAVVRQFVKFELGGGRLTGEGWRNAGNRFFLKPEPVSERKEVRVVSDKSNVRLETLTATANATVSASFPVCWGKIDSQLHFESTGAQSPPGVPVLAGCWESYKLVLSPRKWFLDIDGEVKPFTEGTTATRLRIVDFPKYLTLGRTAAVRYVTEMRNKSSDPLIQKNADQTLATLKKLKE